jgi:large subunit ribosomal protein L9
MKVILLEDISNLGEMGDTVNVKDGYARNFLIPGKKAVPATARNLKTQEHHRRDIDLKKGKVLIDAQSLGDKLSGTALSFTRKSGEKGQLFGSVTNMDIAEALAAQDLSIDRKYIILEDHIKELGEHEVTIKLHSDVNTTISVTVLPEDGELPLEPVEVVSEDTSEEPTEAAVEPTVEEAPAEKAPAEEETAGEETAE